MDRKSLFACLMVNLFNKPLLLNPAFAAGIIRVMEGNTPEKMEKAAAVF